jgi:hypothetical protein
MFFRATEFLNKKNVLELQFYEESISSLLLAIRRYDVCHHKEELY